MKTTNKQLIAAEIRRQRYLDILNAHPEGLKTPAIEAHMRETYGDMARAFNTVNQLAALGEVKAVKTGKFYDYFALKTKTVSADVMADKRIIALRDRAYKQHYGSDYGRHIALANLRASQAKPEQPAVEIPGYYLHKPGKPIPNQEAIGSGRARVFVGCVA